LLAFADLKYIYNLIYYTKIATVAPYLTQKGSKSKRLFLHHEVLKREIQSRWSPTIPFRLEVYQQQANVTEQGNFLQRESYSPFASTEDLN
jgi:hypothetical protein